MSKRFKSLKVNSKNSVSKFKLSSTVSYFPNEEDNFSVSNTEFIINSYEETQDNFRSDYCLNSEINRETSTLNFETEDDNLSNLYQTSVLEVNKQNNTLEKLQPWTEISSLDESIQNISDIYNFDYQEEFFCKNSHGTRKRYLLCEKNFIECCSEGCLGSASDQTKWKVKCLLNNKSKQEIKTLLLNQLKYQKIIGMTTVGFIINSHYFCKKSFSELTKLSIYLINTIFNAYNIGQTYFVHGNTIGFRENVATTGFICWMKRFSHIAGNYSPDEQIIVLSASYALSDIYELYKQEICGPATAKSTFYRLFHSKFGHNRIDKSLPCLRLSKYSSHSRCDECADLEKYRKSAKSEEELKMAKSLMQEHKEKYVSMRLLIEEKRHLSMTDPNHIYIQIDGMDNSKSFLPHVAQKRKSTCGIYKLPTKITGVIIWSKIYGNSNRKVICYIDHDQFEQGSSKLVSILYRVIQQLVKDFNDRLPKYLHLNLDNCWRENKNQFLFSFCSGLVGEGVFTEITVDFMLVGHTGNQVDQIFSILAHEFKAEICSPDDLVRKIKNSSIVPSPVCVNLDFIWNWRDFILPNLEPQRMQNHSFFQAFNIVNENGIGILRAKKYQFDQKWTPEEGIVLLKNDVDLSSQIFASDFRLEKLNLDLVFAHLYTKYFPSLEEEERKYAQSSWEKVRTDLEQALTRNYPPMNITLLPKQNVDLLPSVPNYIQAHFDSGCRELKGRRNMQEPMISDFRNDIKIGTSVVIYTKTKSNRPWVGVVKQIFPCEGKFEVHWYKKKNKLLSFEASYRQDGIPYTEIMSTDTVMLWSFAHDITEHSFCISKELFQRILSMYKDHDKSSSMNDTDSALSE